MPILLAVVASLLVSATPAAPVEAAALPTVPLEALVAASPHGLEPSARARALDGQRIRLVGHMAHLEDAPGGVFYLAARPVECDEGGGGTADLPPEAVRVVVRSAGGAPVRWLPGPIEVTGRFLVGPEADAGGQVAWFRLVLDQVEELTMPAAPSPASPPRATAPPPAPPHP